jgi:hypothetical protein
MYPHLIQFETRQMEIEAQLGVYGVREALAQRALAKKRAKADRPGLSRRVLAFLRPERLSPAPGDC